MASSQTVKQKTASDKDDEDNENGNIAEEEGMEVDASDIMNDGINLDIDEEASTFPFLLSSSSLSLAVFCFSVRLAWNMPSTAPYRKEMSIYYQLVTLLGLSSSSWLMS